MSSYPTLETTIYVASNTPPQKLLTNSFFQIYVFTIHLATLFFLLNHLSGNLVKYKMEQELFFYSTPLHLGKMAWNTIISIHRTPQGIDKPLTPLIII